MRMNPFCLTCLIQSQELQIRNFEDEEKKLRYMKEILGYLSAGRFGPGSGEVHFQNI